MAILVTCVSAVNVTVVCVAKLFASVDAAMQGAETPDSKVAIAQDRTDRALKVEVDIVREVSWLGGFDCIRV